MTYEERTIVCPKCGCDYPEVEFYNPFNPKEFEVHLKCHQCGYSTDNWEEIHKAAKKVKDD